MALPTPWGAWKCSDGSGTTLADDTADQDHARPLVATGSLDWVTGHDGEAGGAVSLDPGENAKWTSAIAGFSACTIECWYKPSGLATGETELVVGFFSGGFFSSTRFAIWAQRSDFGTPDKLVGQYRNGGLNSVYDESALVDNTWVHLALTWDGATVVLYRNGTPVGSAAFASGGTAWSDIDSFGIGGSTDASRALQDIRVFDVALTSAQVTEAMTTPVGASPPSATGDIAQTLPALTTEGSGSVDNPSPTGGLYSVWESSPPPGVYAWYTDANPSIWTMMGFYRTVTGTPVVAVAGARLWVTSDALAANSSVTIRAFRGGYAGSGIGDVNAGWDAGPVATKTMPLTGTGWNQVLFDSLIEADVTERIYIAVQYDGNVQGYQHSGSLPNAGPVLAENGMGFALGAVSDQRSVFKIGSNSLGLANNSAMYGLDIIYTDGIPDPVHGAIVQSLPALTTAASGSVDIPTFTGNAAQTLPALSQQLTGDIAPPTYHGAVVQSLPALTQALAGEALPPEFTGVVVQLLPHLTQAASGRALPPAAGGTIVQVLPRLTQQATGSASWETTGDIAQTLPSLRTAASGGFIPELGEEGSMAWLNWLDPLVYSTVTTGCPDPNFVTPNPPDTTVQLAVSEASAILTRLTSYLIHPAGEAVEDFKASPHIHRMSPNYLPIKEILQVWRISLDNGLAQEIVDPDWFQHGNAIYFTRRKVSVLSWYRSICGCEPFSDELLRLRYSFGNTVTQAARRAALYLARQLWLSCHTGEGECELPERVTSVNREGLSYTIIDPQTFLDMGRTGLPKVDLWLTSVNPNRSRRPSGVWTPDAPPAVNRNFRPSPL